MERISKHCKLENKKRCKIYLDIVQIDKFKSVEEKMRMKRILILNGAPKKNGNTAALIKAFRFTITGTLKTAVDRLYDIQRNHGFEEAKRETAFLMTSGGPAEMNPLAIQWYQMFEQMGWKSLGAVLGTGKEDEARKLGASIH